MAPPTADTRIKAVRVACEEENKTGNDKHKQFTTYDILPIEPIFTDGELSELSERVGLPVLIRKLRPSLIPPHKRDLDKRGRPRTCFSSSTNANYYPNQTASDLMVRCSGTATAVDGNNDNNNAQAGLFGIPAAWQEHVGSVLIARKDGQALYPTHVVMMLSYFYNTIEDNGDMLLEGMAALLSPEGFKEHYTVGMAGLIGSDETHEWAVTPSPFGETLAEEVELEWILTTRVL